MDCFTFRTSYIQDPNPLQFCCVNDDLFHSLLEQNRFCITSLEMQQPVRSAFVWGVAEAHTKAVTVGSVCWNQTKSFGNFNDHFMWTVAKPPCVCLSSASLDLVLWQALLGQSFVQAHCTHLRGHGLRPSSSA